MKNEYTLEAVAPVENHHLFHRQVDFMISCMDKPSMKIGTVGIGRFVKSTQRGIVQDVYVYQFEVIYISLGARRFNVGTFTDPNKAAEAFDIFVDRYLKAFGVNDG